MGQRTLIALGLAAAAAGLSGAWFVGARSGHSAADAEPQATAAGEALRAQRSSNLACLFQPGARAAFRIDSSVEARGSKDAVSSDRFNAVLSWQVLEETRPHEWLLRAALSSVRVVQALSEPDQRLSQPLDAAFMLRIGRDCRFLHKGYAMAWQPTTRRFVASMLGTFEFAVAPDGSSTAWQLDQTDGMGRYAAKYAALRLPGGEFALTKEKTHYRDPQRAMGLGLQIQLVHSAAQGTLDPAGHWLRRAEGVERIRLRAREALLADVEQRFALTRDDKLFAPPDGTVEAAALDWQDPFLMPNRNKPGTDPQIAKLTREAAMVRFAEVYNKTPKGDAYASALFLAQWLRAHPDEAQRLLDQIRAGKIAEAMRPAAFLALEQCGTPQARSALTQALFDSSLAEMDRARAASALSDVPEPTPESARALVEAARGADSKLAAAASIRAVGHLQERARSLNPELQDELRRVLKDELATAPNGSRAIDVVDAIGNTGDPSFAGELNLRLGDASPAMREHAARAYRRMDQPAVAPPLVARLPVEPDPGVRVAIAESLGAMHIRDSTAVARAAQQLASEPSPNVRAALINWLGAAVDLPVARAALVAQFRQEKDPRLLQLIGRYLPADALK